MSYAIFFATTLLSLPVQGTPARLLTDLLVAVLMTYHVTPWLVRRLPAPRRAVRSRLERLRRVEEGLRPGAQVLRCARTPVSLCSR